MSQAESDQTNGMQTLFVGITGAFGSGCSTSAKYLSRKHGFKHVSLSTILKKQLVNGSRSKLQDLGNNYRSQDDKFLMLQALEEAVEGESEEQPVRIVAEAIRHPAEAEFLVRNLPNAFILAIYASPESRMAWNNIDSAEKVKEFIEADKRDSGETEPAHGQKVTKCVNMADYFIANYGSKQELYDKLDKFVQAISGDCRPRDLTDEVMMSHAYMQRLFSLCKGRQVGAVIARDRHVISAGWNDVPPGKEPCQICNRKRIRKCAQCGKDLLQNIGTCPDGHMNEDRKDILEKHLDLCYAVHAEERAILNAVKNGISLAGATLYCTTFPCLMCAKTILEVGIKNLVYVEPYPQSTAEELFGKEVEVRRFEGFTAKNLYRIYARKE